MSCGSLFNPHKWKYPHKDFRICEKCGETEGYVQVDYFEKQWKQEPFDFWLNRLNSKKNETDPFDGKKKALEWLSRLASESEKHE